MLRSIMRRMWACIPCLRMIRLFARLIARMSRGARRLIFMSRGIRPRILGSGALILRLLLILRYACVFKWNIRDLSLLGCFVCLVFFLRCHKGSTDHAQCALYQQPIDISVVNNYGQRQPPANKNGEEFYIRVRGSNGTPTPMTPSPYSVRLTAA